MDTKFEWDLAKAADNLRKHGVSFDEATTAFFDDNALVIPDPDHSNPAEERFILLGFSAMARLLVVVHCLRASGRRIRLISARKATRREAQDYSTRWIR